MARSDFLHYVHSAYPGCCVSLVPSLCGVVLRGYRSGLGCVDVYDVLLVVFSDFFSFLFLGDYSYKGDVIGAKFSCVSFVCCIAIIFLNQFCDVLYGSGLHA